MSSRAGFSPRGICSWDFFRNLSSAVPLTLKILVGLQRVMRPLEGATITAKSAFQCQSRGERHPILIGGKKCFQLPDIRRENGAEVAQEADAGGRPEHTFHECESQHQLLRATLDFVAF